MLDVETKSRINTARDILVGKVPDPKSQVEQITIALIYKFMDDMDMESEELGGKRTFFAGEYAKYAWRKIFDPRLSGQELLNLYSEAIGTMDTNPGVPKLFRDIFKNAYLPYRDPETLKSFLKIINEFDYSHSEKLGDAFEYLLSVLGSQGNAGQFRTPRHIIDFMVEIVDPKKDETILDPACGTAGFLISSYKHIVRQNSSNNNPDEHNGISSNGDQSVADRIISTNGYGGDKLTADDRKLLAKNIQGYDISPDMVRLSLVNMYLHGIKDPKIFEYDTLTSEDNWHHFSDVILANPPFMTPKGGIRPHKRFSVQSNRSEVLFVDYIAEHLTTNGRAAVIVPEGIIFQSGKAYRQLRKKLVDDYLVGVISLPAGVFNPYAGVKTSIIWLDKVLAKKTDKILFVKIENDGFDLGAQRRSIKKNDLPNTLSIINRYRVELQSNNAVDDGKILFVSKNELRSTDDYNLSGERYKKTIDLSSSYPHHKLDDLFDIQRGGSPRPIQDYITDSPDGINWIKIGDAKESSKYISQTEEKIRPEGLRKSRLVQPGDFILSNSMSFGRPYIMKTTGCIHDGWLVFKAKAKEINNDYIYSILTSDNVKLQFEIAATGGVVRNLNISLVKDVKIPVPPLSVQNEIAAEIDSYQKIIDGARQVVENYKPRIDIDPEWEMVELGEVCKLYTGGTPRSTVTQFYEGGDIKWLVSGDIHKEEIFDCEGRITEDGLQSSNARYLPINSVLIALNGQGKTRGTVAMLRVKATCNQSIVAIDPIDKGKLLPEFLYLQLKSRYQEIRNITGDNQRSGLNMPIIRSIKIYLPEISIQTMLVNEFMQDNEMVKSNKVLIERFTIKIKDRIAKVWGE